MQEKIEILGRYNFWGGGQIDCGTMRPLYLDKIGAYVGNRLIKVIVGQRRVGKSFIMRQIASRLVADGVDSRNILMVNIDVLGTDFVRNDQELTALFCEYEKRIARPGRVFLFIDEIQNVDGWEKFVNSFSQDYTRECEIFITGSNSKMLSSELATLLSGRYVTFEVLPLSFNEWCDFVHLSADRNSFIQYQSTGGLPELLSLSGEESCRNYVSSLRDTILMRDIVTRYGVADVELLSDLFAFAVNNVSSMFSASSLVKYYKGKGRKVGYEKIAQYIQHLCDAYLLHRVCRYDIRGKETIGGMCKYYPNDPAYHRFLYPHVGFGVGYVLENLVFLSLRRAGYEVSVGSNAKQEIDFVASRGDRILYVQSAYMLVDQTTIEREYGALEKINDNYEKVVVSLDDLQLPSRGGIRHVRAWDLNGIL